MAGRTRTTKKLAQRIDLHYFKRAYPIPRWKRLLTIAAAALSVAWLGWAGLTGKQSAFNAGPLSKGHTILTNNCSSCHVAAGFGTRITETACLSCHDAPIHQAKQSFTPACTTCHIEHQGSFKLAAISSASCTQCHRELKFSGAGASRFANITSFTGDHPDFAAVRPGHPADPGTIKLSHQVHLKNDLKGPNGPVQLVCASCHGVTNRSPTYAEHCAACHPLVFDSRFSEPVPHKDTQTVHDFVVRNQANIAQSIDQAERLLWQKTCKECHTLTYPAPETRPEIAKAAIPAKWMTNTLFDHKAHQLVGCVECHAQAKTSNRTEDVLLPGIATCRKCHNNSRYSAGASCSECHLYHDWTKAKPASSLHAIADFVR
jgi:hypothetical protein